MQKIIYLAPRWLGILFVIFASLFALDVFGQNFSWLALLTHLIPTFILTAVLAVAWRHEYTGGIIFIGLGVLYMLMVWGSFLWLTVFIVSVPAIVIGLLFLANEFILKRKQD